MIDLRDTDMDARPRNILRRVGILTLEDASLHTEQYLLSIPNFGKLAIEDVKRVLANFGLGLAEPGKDHVESPDATIRRWQEHKKEAYRVAYAAEMLRRRLFDKSWTVHTVGVDHSRKEATPMQADSAFGFLT